MVHLFDNFLAILIKYQYWIQHKLMLTPNETIMGKVDGTALAIKISY